VFASFQQWLSAEAFGAFLIFVRVGAAFSLLPGFAEAYVPVRARLLLAATVSFVLVPVIAPGLPPTPNSVPGLLLLLGFESGIGAFLGLIARFTFTSLQTAGVIIGMQTSLSAAFAFDPSTAQQGALTASFLGALALVSIFVTDLHHLMLRAIADSYTLFPPGGSVPIGDFADVLARLLSSSFLLGVRIGSPFLVFGVIFFLGLGILARLMPQMQVFFVSQPVQILLGLVIFAGIMFAAMSVFLGSFEGAMAMFIAPNR
jgi:flagellar biosynthetic protein FliR